MKILSQWKLNYHKFEFRTTIEKKESLFDARILKQTQSKFV